MEFFERSQLEQRGIERAVLMGFTLYVSVILFSAFQNGWSYWIMCLAVVCLFAAWFIHIIQYRSFVVRTIVTTCLIQVCLLIYGIHCKSYEQLLPMFFAVSALTALYGAVDYMYISLASILIITFNFAFVRGNQLVVTEDVHNYNVVLRQFLNVLVFEVVIIIWLKKRNQAFGETRKVIEALKRAEHTKNDFLANISHELRTPLNTIIGMSEIIMQEQDVDKIKEYVYQIQNSSRTLMSTVNDVLDFTELQSGELKIEEEEYDIRAMINSITQMGTALKTGKDIELIVNIDPGLPKTLYGDEKKIRRVIMNLLNNAIKFTESGYLELNFAARQESYGINLSIMVKDSGIGMREENIDKLFDSFSRVDAKRNRQEGGIGLGLAISRAIAETLGGLIRVQSKYGVGSTFTFVVPQKTVNEEKIIEVRSDIKPKVICYVNLERFRMNDIRDSYNANILGMINACNVECNYCRNLDELKRRLKREEYTHAFITNEEYMEDQVFFNELAKKLKLAVVMDYEKDNTVTNEDVYKIYKPCHLLKVVNFLNSQANTVLESRENTFVSPDTHVLVVDDNLMNIRVIEGILKRYQIKCTHALSGTEALKLIESMDYDFVFMDHMMPEMDGVEVTHRIRDKGGSYYTRVPIIALTANAVAGSREMFLKEGFSDFIEKPVEVSVLDRVLRRTIPQGKIIYEESGTEISEPIAVETVKEVSEPVEQKFQIGNLNVENGIMYCGSREAYIEIATICCMDYPEVRRDLEQIFARQDWDNYIIKIHALKSTMKGIGADECSAMALELEMAGRNGDYDKILAGHDSVMEKYKDTIMMIAASPYIKIDEELIKMEPEAAKDEVRLEGLEVMSREELIHFRESFEEKMYSLDQDGMLMLLDYADHYQYNGTSLCASFSRARGKIEQEDYFSAGELVNQICEELTKEGGTGGNETFTSKGT